MKKILKLIILAVIFFTGVFIFTIDAKMIFKKSNNIPKIDLNKPADIRKAVFALGCFWSPDAKFGVLDGVVYTRVGYAGGRKNDPTYHDLGNHTESVEVFYNPKKITFRDLVEIFWKSHNSTSKSYSNQYKNILFYIDEKQHKIAADFIERQREKSNGKIRTELIKLNEFYPAEDYHQKYRLRNSRVFMNEFKRIYSDQKDFRDSTAAARVNGYLSGYGNIKQLKMELPSLGLSQDSQEKLLDIVKHHSAPADSCPAP